MSSDTVTAEASASARAAFKSPVFAPELHPPFPITVLPSSELSHPAFKALIHQYANPKARSTDTHYSTHVPALTESPSPRTVLLGDSMFERLKTTGAATVVGRAVAVFNAGVGGDGVANVLHRIDLGLLGYLKETRLVVVGVGTNNLVAGKKGKPGKPLGRRDYERYHLMLQAIVRCCPDAKILCCGFYGRKDVDDESVRRSNEGVRALLEILKDQIGDEEGLDKGKIRWLAPVEGVSKDDLEDHVHLNEEGYRKWDEGLAPAIEKILGETS